MTTPQLTSLEADGWCIDDVEVAHAATPETFEIPALSERATLAPGDSAQLRFYIRVEEEDGEPEDYGERMWVEVKDHMSGWYRGLLLNQPNCTLEISPGWEVWFQPRHVLNLHNKCGQNEQPPAP